MEIEEGVKWGIQTAVNPSIYDLGGIKFGYVGMIESFWNHLRAFAKPLWSREEIDIKDILRKRFPQTENDYQLTYRLWKTRVIATYLDYYLKNNEYQFMISIKEGMNGIKPFMRHAILIERGKLKSDYTDSIVKEFIEIFPQLKEKVLNTYEFFDLWPKLVEEKNYDEMLNFYFNALK